METGRQGERGRGEMNEREERWRKLKQEKTVMR